MSEPNKPVREFYNNFSGRQIRTGINLRHRTILHFLKKAGLKRHHEVLEMGCGIGTLSSLLSGYLSKGHVTGVDISNESVVHAKKLNSKNKNIQFLVSDLLELNLNIRYDFIVLPDVIEHIPEDSHSELFRIIRNHSKENTVLFIHVPAPRYLEYLAVNQPERLQIIDQPLEAGSIIKNAEEAGFELKKYQSYSLYVREEDYRQIVFKVRRDLKSINRVKYLKMVFKELKSRFK